MPGRGRPRNTRQGGDPAEQVANRDPRDIKEIERLQQRIRELELQEDERNEETESNSAVWDDGFEGEENPFCRRPPPQARSQNRGDILRSLGVRVEILEFMGTTQPDEFIDWISTVERVFDLRDIPENLKVKVVAIKLRKYACLWWDHVKQKQRQQGKSQVETWDMMKKILRAKFLPINYRQNAFFEYYSLMQNNSSVEQFIADFDRLRMRCGAGEDEEQLQQLWTLDDVFRLALKVEKQLGNKTRSTPTRPPPPVRNSAPTGSNPRNAPMQRSEGSSMGNVNQTASKQCYKCQGLGHYARECPNKQLVTFVDDTTCEFDTDGEDVIFIASSHINFLKWLSSSVVEVTIHVISAALKLLGVIRDLLKGKVFWSFADCLVLDYLQLLLLLLLSGYSLFVFRVIDCLLLFGLLVFRLPACLLVMHLHCLSMLLVLHYVVCVAPTAPPPILEIISSECCLPLLCLVVVGYPCDSHVLLGVGLLVLCVSLCCMTALLGFVLCVLLLLWDDAYGSVSIGILLRCFTDHKAASCRVTIHVISAALKLCKLFLLLILKLIVVALFYLYACLLLLMSHHRAVVVIVAAVWLFSVCLWSDRLPSLVWLVDF
ncbi:reverse transcriptase domain-containing protein [Tanacetum coccineum]